MALNDAVERSAADLQLAIFSGSPNRQASGRERCFVDDSRVEAGENTTDLTGVEPLGTFWPFDDNKPALVRRVSACVVCCSTSSISNNVIHTVTGALSAIATVQSVVLSATAEKLPGIDVMEVPQGTKLSKIRRLGDFMSNDLICICDPDLRANEEACRQVFARAVAEIHRGNDVVAFGIVEGIDDGTMLSRVIALDKWLSHRVLRRILWGCGVGITIPGQFLVVSARLLRDLDPKVDSYLDDLYLGWVARTNNVQVHRVPVVVGEEEPRTTWGSLLTQRLRWMRGLACLFGHLAAYRSAVLLLTIHYLAYHGLPILMFLGFLSLAVFSPIGAAVPFFGLVLLLARHSGQSVWTAATFVLVFPGLHCLATLLWWIPARRSFLARR